ncbi:MAG: S8 family serine peptidase [Candidatus Hydrogenedentes bacterium]|nr:S8 family serine peptidase [Candidatus Hydrogenedentota bacterium]
MNCDYLRRSKSERREFLKFSAAVLVAADIDSANQLGNSTPRESELQDIRLLPPQPPQQLHAYENLTKWKLADCIALIRADLARERFGIDGSGLTVAVLDTGLNTTHVDFAGKDRIPATMNFTSNDQNDVTDSNGHGTHLGGIIVANGLHKGVAPCARIVPVKVTNSTDFGWLSVVCKGLEYVQKHHDQYGISVVNISYEGEESYTADDHKSQVFQKVRGLIRELRDEDVATVISAGNRFYPFSKEGMSIPAIARESISVGAVYSISDGYQPPVYGAWARKTAPDQITPYTKRLHASTPTAECCTDLFAPGGTVQSTGIQNNVGFDTGQGTSQAAAFVSGVVLLVQHYIRKTTGQLPSVEDIEQWLVAGSVDIQDAPSDPPIDNVVHTNKTFRRVDALGALEAAQSYLVHAGFQKQKLPGKCFRGRGRKARKPR